MERSISATDANREFSRLLSEVANGDSFVVTSRGKPVARVEPIVADKPNQDERRARFRAMMKRVSERPPQNLGPFTRDDGYE